MPIFGETRGNRLNMFEHLKNVYGGYRICRIFCFGGFLKITKQTLSKFLAICARSSTWVCCATQHFYPKLNENTRPRNDRTNKQMSLSSHTDEQQVDFFEHILPMQIFSRLMWDLSVQTCKLHKLHNYSNVAQTH